MTEIEGPVYSLDFCTTFELTHLYHLSSNGQYAALTTQIQDFNNDTESGFRFCISASIGQNGKHTE